MSTSQKNMESTHTSLSPLLQKSQALAKQVAQEIVKTYGDWELAGESGIRLSFHPGWRQSIISSDLLIDSGQEQILHFSFMDTATGVKWNGEIPFQLICDVLAEQQRLENEN